MVACSKFNCEIKQGQIVGGLIGPNGGAGKTTIFNLITGGVYRPPGGPDYIQPTAGEDYQLIGLTPDRIAKLGICRTFQNIRLFKELSVLDNVFIGNHLRLKSNVFSTILRLPGGYRAEEKAIYAKSLYLLER